MNQYRLVVSYDGTNYHGWQTQPKLSTVANTLQKTFVSCFNAPATIVGVSRTDAGVHALHQIASVRTAFALETDKLLYAWNNRLPDDIVIRSLEQTKMGNHLFEAVVSKTYYYHFFDRRPLPFIERYGTYVTRAVDHAKLQEALRVFIGTHNFRSFSTGNERGDDTVRTIDSISLRYLARFGVYRITVKGKAFLQHMIRRIVGASLEVACRPTLSSAHLTQALDACNPNQVFPSAPAKGLMLYKIYYKNTVR